jgi:hypothetical protein
VSPKRAIAKDVTYSFYYMGIALVINYELEKMM